MIKLKDIIFDKGQPPLFDFNGGHDHTILDLVRSQPRAKQRINEASAPMVIANALDAIRWEARRKSPEVETWLKPYLRKIENAMKKWERSGG